MKKLHLRRLLDFYDHKVETSRGHASAISAVLGEDLAVALMCHFFETSKLKVNALPETCATGKKKGHRLDKWIAVDSALESVIYQVEIKNWSAHSIGGTTIKEGMSSEEMIAYRKDRWKRQFKTIELVHAPSQEGTKKVLKKMSVPKPYGNHQHRALLCFWEALHPDGKGEPFFNVNVASENFDDLYLFSMSNYIWRLLEQTESLEVTMQDTDNRIDWLNNIYN
jgi:hypothetical protein